MCACVCVCVCACVCVCVCVRVCTWLCVRAADLKPDNILIGGDKRSLLKVCDFGNAIPYWELSEYKATPYLQSPFYRAPEVILGYARTAAMDVWSAGCVLFEVFTGTFCFTGSCNRDILWSMQEVRARVSTVRGHCVCVAKSVRQVCRVCCPCCRAALFVFEMGCEACRHFFFAPKVVHRPHVRW